MAAGEDGKEGRMNRALNSADAVWNILSDVTLRVKSHVGSAVSHADSSRKCSNSARGSCSAAVLSSSSSSCDPASEKGFVHC